MFLVVRVVSVQAHGRKPTPRASALAWPWTVDNLDLGVLEPILALFYRAVPDEADIAAARRGGGRPQIGDVPFGMDVDLGGHADGCNEVVSIGGGRMHVQMINFTLVGMTEEEWRGAGRGMASRYSALPGLLAKIWVANRESNRYGAVYLWRDRAAMEEFNASEFMDRIKSHPNYADITLADFVVLDDLTKETEPGLQVVQ